MTIDHFRTDDIDLFLTLARGEEWLAEQWEVRFLLAQFPRGCFAARAENGEAVGFVTSLCHDRSGWIGNLIVAAPSRGNGLGGVLFRKALDALYDSGVETVWLTASAAGMPLYEKFGFSRIDTIVRWSGSGRQRAVGQETEPAGICFVSSLNDIDSQAWGDKREALVAETAGRGTVIRQESAFVVVQQYGDERQLGPFTAPGYGTAEVLLKAALGSISSDTRVFLDSPASNKTAAKLLSRNRMKISGTTELMYAGVKPAFQPEYIFGLATMGSCG